VGEAKAKELIFTARVLSGEEAAEIGLAEYAVPQNAAGDAAFQKALEIAKEIATKVARTVYVVSPLWQCCRVLD